MTPTRRAKSLIGAAVGGGFAGLGGGALAGYAGGALAILQLADGRPIGIGVVAEFIITLATAGTVAGAGVGFLVRLRRLRRTVVDTTHSPAPRAGVPRGSHSG